MKRNLFIWKQTENYFTNGESKESNFKLRQKKETKKRLIFEILIEIIELLLLWL